MTDSFKGYWYRIPLLAKMVFLAFSVSVLTVFLTDYLQRFTVSSALEQHLREELEEKAMGFRLDFSRYVNAHTQAVKIFVSRTNLVDYIHEQEWSASDQKIDIKQYKNSPPWFPPPPVLRTFANPRYAVLLDSGGRVREVFNSGPADLPEVLLHPTNRLMQLSKDVSYLTSLNGIPHLITSESIVNSQRNSIGVMILSSPFDQEFIIASQRYSTKKFIVALTSDDPDRIIISSDPERINRGILIDDLKDEYIILRQELFAYGTSDMTFKFISFLPKSRVHEILKPIIKKARLHHFLQAFFFFGMFSLILFYITRRIVLMTGRINQFSREALGGKSNEKTVGDELYALENRFQLLTQEVASANKTIKHEAEERLDFMKKYAELEYKEKQLKLLQEVTEVLGVGVVTLDETRKYDYNKQMDHFIKNFGGLAPFDIQAGLSAKITIYSHEGKSHLFDIMSPKLLSEEKIILVRDITEQTKTEAKIKTWGMVLERRIREKTNELLKSQAQLIHSEKLSAMGHMAGGLAHELNSPLAGLLPMLEKYRDEAKKGSQQFDELTLMLRACEYMAKIVRDFGSYSRESTGKQYELDITEVIEDTLSFSGSTFIQKKIQLTKAYEKDLPKILGEKTELQQVVLNMLTNAYDASPVEGEISISTKAVENGNKVQVEFTDSGTGIEKENLSRIFDPFFTTKKPGEGTGLGLSLSYGIIEKHGGTISVKSSPETGTIFTITLPAVHSSNKLQETK